MNEGCGGGSGAALSKLYDSFLGGEQGGDGQHANRQQRPTDSQQECQQRDAQAQVGLDLKEQRAQELGDQRRCQGAQRHRGHRQQQPFHQHQNSDLKGGGASALQHSDFRAARPHGQRGDQCQVVGQYSGDQEHHQEQGDASQEQLL